MNQIGAYWKTLGAAIAEGIRGAKPDDVMAEVATRVLQETPAPRIDASGIAEWLVEETTLPEQVNFHSGFGEPPLVVFVAPEFYIEVLFWFPGPTSIHGHGFKGAFVVLDGFSIQVEYDFHEESAPEEAIRLGRLQARAVEFIAPGKVCTIRGGADFIHTVSHLGNPSLTLVARTFGRANVAQFRYHRCGFAVHSAWNRPLVARQAEVLAAVHQSLPAVFPPRLVRLLGRVGDTHFYHLLEALMKAVTLPVFTTVVMPLLAEHFAATRAAPVAAIRERVRTRSIWVSARAFPNVAAQVQCALSDLFPDAAEREAILHRSYGVASSRDLPERWRDLVLGATSAAARG